MFKFVVSLFAFAELDWTFHRSGQTRDPKTGNKRGTQGHFKIDNPIHRGNACSSFSLCLPAMSDLIHGIVHLVLRHLQKSGTVRVWSALTRRECTLGGRPASVNVVKWGVCCILPAVIGLLEYGMLRVYVVCCLTSGG